MDNIKENSLAVVVDMQNDFLIPEGALYVEGYELERKLYGDNIRLINDIKKFIDEFMNISDDNLYVTTEDYHPSDSIEFTVFPPHCVKSTIGQQYPEELHNLYENAEMNIRKGQRSGVFSYSISTMPNFDSFIVYLGECGFKNIYVMGVAYNYCVGESAISLACQGFNVNIIRNLTRSVPGPDSIFTMNKKLGLYGVNTIEV